MPEKPIDIYGVFKVEPAPDRAEEHKQKFFGMVRDLPHRGQGLNVAILAACNTGINAGLAPDEVAAAIILERGNEVKPGEVERAVMKATDGKGYVSATMPKPRTVEQKNRDKIAADDSMKDKLNMAYIQAGGVSIDMRAPELWEASTPRPIGYTNPAKMQGGEALTDILYFLKTFYRDEEYLFIGKQFDKGADNVKQAGEWFTFFRDAITAAKTEADIVKLGEAYPYIIPNPLTGRADKNGSFRTDANIAAFRFVVIESDDLLLDQQIPLFRGLHLPVFTLTYSGSKSIHALVNAEALTGKKIETLEQWKTEVKEGYFKGLFQNVKIDHATSNPARLSRTPGMYRKDKKNFQRTIYNNAKGADLWQTINKYL